MPLSDVFMPRIPADPKLFRDEFMRHCRPCVVTGLYEGAPLDRIRTMADVRSQLGTGTVALRSNYMNAMISQLEDFVSGAISYSQLYSRVTAEKRVTLSQYLDMLDKNGGREPYADYANEQKPPQEVMDRLGDLKFLKELGYGKTVAWENDAGMDYDLPPDITKVVLFMSNVGNCADTHTDWDGRHVLNHQLVGTKRFVLFPPEAAIKLNAVESYPAPRVRRMEEGERHELLRYAGGVECVIGPGEACYMPPFYYHHIDYLTDAIGVAVRIEGPPRDIIPTMISETHRDGFMQAFWATVLRDPKAPRHIDGVKRLERALEQNYPSRVAKYQAIVTLVRNICDEWHVFGKVAQTPWVASSELLQRPLSTPYLRPPSAWSKTKKRWWTVRETARLAAATLASRAVATIEGTPKGGPKHVEAPFVPAPETANGHAPAVGSERFARV
jgi:hypothetical protein